MGTKMSGDEINTMLRMYEKGETAKVIGQKIGRSPSVISSTILRMKKQLTSRDLPPEKIQMQNEVVQEYITAYKQWKETDMKENLFLFEQRFRKMFYQQKLYYSDYFNHS